MRHDEQIRLDLQVQALMAISSVETRQDARFRRLFLCQQTYQHLLPSLLLKRFGDAGADPAEQRRHLLIIFTQTVFRRLGIRYSPPDR